MVPTPLILPRAPLKEQRALPFPKGEPPKYPALKEAINGYYDELIGALDSLRDTVFVYLPLSDPAKAEAEPFRYTAKMRRTID
jgi:hypothetical protein